MAWQELTAHMARGFAVPILFLLWALGVALLWAFSSRPGRLRRLLSVGVVAGLLIFAARQVLRYEGSADGTARPKLVWRWTPKQAERVLTTGEPAVSPHLARGEVGMPAGAEPWLRFMGAAGDGRVPVVNWSIDWQKNPPVEKWRVEVGEGWSGFTVVDGRAYTMEQRGETECVTCYRLEGGELLWLHRHESRFDEALGGQGPRSTPTLDPERGCLYALGAVGQLHCLDLVTGEARWTRDVLADTGGRNLTYAKSAAPLVVEGRVIVTGGKVGATLIAYGVADGEPVWKAGTDEASYASPVLLTLAGREQVVSVNAATVTGHDPADGDLLWKFDWPGKLPKVGQPIAVSEDRFLVTSGYGMKSHLLEIKQGSMSDEFTVNALWTASTPRTKFSSASVVGEHLYAMDEGTLVCVRLSDGVRVWRSGRYGYGQHLLCAEDLLLIQTEPGPVVLVRASPEGLQEIAKLPGLSSKTWNPPALAGRWLLLRNDREAVCYELSATP